MSRNNCIYCGQPITERSREHVIQNAIGGMYESVDICCPQCNNYVSKYIDAPFTKIFNPIISGIDNFSKTNNKKSLQPCTGTVSYNGQMYHANIKGGKVVNCPDLSRALHCDATELPLKIESYDFNLENTAFKNGMAKIAFNYALDQGIDFNKIKHGLNVQKSGGNITNISFDYPLIPFCALNPLDLRIELETPFTPYHSLILFRQNHKLWCYIDLFNTFQFYVLMSDKMPGNNKVYNTYAQTLQKIDRSEPELDIHRPKDILICAKDYGVEPCMDLEEFKKRVRVAIQQKSQKISLDKIITPKAEYVSYNCILDTQISTPEKILLGQHVALYFDDDDDDDDRLNTNNFRTVTLGSAPDDILSYPELINYTAKQSQTYLHEYSNAKFAVLNNFLCQNTK